MKELARKRQRGDDDGANSGNTHFQAHGVLLSRVDVAAIRTVLAFGISKHPEIACAGQVIADDFAGCASLFLENA